MIASMPNTRRVASAMRLYSVEPLPMIFWSRVPKNASAASHAAMSRAEKSEYVISRRCSSLRGMSCSAALAPNLRNCDP